jgi:hypothetical protein
MIKILCDNCDADLTYSRGGYDHCLCLKNRHFGPDSSAVVDYYMYPLLDADVFFCGFGCLEKWMEKRKEKDGMD